MRFAATTIRALVREAPPRSRSARSIRPCSDPSRRAARCRRGGHALMAVIRGGNPHECDGGPGRARRVRFLGCWLRVPPGATTKGKALPKPASANSAAVLVYIAVVLTAVAFVSIVLVAMVGPESAGGFAIIGMPLPALVALAVERLGTPKSRRRPLGEVFATRTPPRRLLVGIGAATVAVIGALAAQLLIGGALGMFDYRLPGDLGGVIGLIAVQFAIMLIASTGEELGWRGWLHTRLRPAGLGIVMVVTAIVWVLFHVPFISMTGAASPVEWASMIASIASASVLFTALRERFESVRPAVVGHALLNSVVLGVQSGFTTAHEGSAAELPLVALICAAFFVAAALIVRPAGRAPVVDAAA